MPSRFAAEVRKRKGFYRKLQTQIERQVRELRTEVAANKQSIVKRLREDSLKADGALEALTGIQTLLIEAGVEDADAFAKAVNS